MKTNLKKLLVIFALALPVVFAACKKNNDDVNPEVPGSKLTSVKFSFSEKGIKAADGNVNLKDAASVKISYHIADGSIQPQAFNESTLAVTGDASKVSTIDQKIFTVKTGSTINIQSASLLDAKGNIIATIAAPDSFKAENPDGTMAMERSYQVSGIER